MPVRAPDATVRHLLVVLPNWVGDVALASPVLAALRTRFADAQITYALRAYVGEIVAGCGWHDQLLTWPGKGGGTGASAGVATIRRLRAERFDLALLLTNSFRSAMNVFLAGVPRRVGYARDGRSGMLTDGVPVLKRAGEFVPSSVLPYYVRLAEAIGCPVPDATLRLGVSPEQEQAGRALRAHYGLDRGRPYALVNPGAAFGAAKCWLPERFAQVCRRLPAEHGLRPVLVGNAHTEGGLMRHIARLAGEGTLCCDDPPTTLGTLKVLARGASLLVCNDTGPRHFGIAFGIPVVTIFGPTHQEWTDTGYAREIKLQVPVECGPCQRKSCPLDLRCLTGLTADMVMQAVGRVLRSGAAGAAAQ